jgi:hypothetical protein
MACKHCESTQQQDLKFELVIVFPDRKRLNQPPVCVRQQTLVCVDCGSAELVLSPADLQKLRKNLSSLSLDRATAN